MYRKTHRKRFVHEGCWEVLDEGVGGSLTKHLQEVCNQLQEVNKQKELATPKTQSYHLTWRKTSNTKTTWTNDILSTLACSTQNTFPNPWEGDSKFELAYSHARVTSIKSQQHQSFSQSVSSLVPQPTCFWKSDGDPILSVSDWQWSDLDPITNNNSVDFVVLIS